MVYVINSSWCLTLVMFCFRCIMLITNDNFWSSCLLGIIHNVSFLYIYISWCIHLRLIMNSLSYSVFSSIHFVLNSFLSFIVMGYFLVLGNVFQPCATYLILNPIYFPCITSFCFETIIFVNFRSFFILYFGLGCFSPFISSPNILHTTLTKSSPILTSMMRSSPYTFTWKT